MTERNLTVFLTGIAFAKRLIKAVLACSLAANGLVFAQSSLEEIVVTAQKREQSLQDVNLAVSAVTGHRMEQQQIDTAQDLQAVVPGLSVGNDFAFPKIVIRGVGMNSSFAGVEPSVGMHVDGAVVALSYAHWSSYFDLERVEVLRGPQGTLYGKNTTGGAINLITRKPTEEFEGYARVTVGDYQLMRLEGAVSGSLTDGVNGRFAFKSTDREGFGRNIVTNNDVDDANKQSFRGSLLFDTGEESDLIVSAEHHVENDAAVGLKYTAMFSMIDPSYPNAPGFGGYASGKRDISSELDNVNDRESTSLTAIWNNQLNDNLRLTSITNHRDTDILLVQDIDYSSTVLPQKQTNGTSSKQFSEELQLHFDSGPMRGLLAFYYFDEQMNNNNNIGFNLAKDGRTTNVLLTADIDIQSAAVFGNLTYDVSDQFSVNIGGRWSEEERDVGSTYNLFFLASPTRTYSESKTISEFKPSFGIEWKPVEDTLVYASYSEGFKGGGFLSGGLAPILRPEMIENIELGVKGMYLDGRLMLNFSAFSAELTDMHYSRTRPTANGAFTTVYENAAAAESEGFELEGTLLASDQLRFDFNVSVLDAVFTDFQSDNPLYSGVELVDLSGNKLRQSPDLSWFLRSEYEVPMKSGGALTFGAEASFKDDQFFTEFNDPITSQDSYTIYNMNVKYVAPGEQFTVNLWGNNIGDEYVRSAGYMSSLGRSVANTALPPSTWGITFGYDF